MDINNKIIGINLAKFRKLKDMKAADLAERIGMKEASYTKYERGESAITIDLVQKIASALEVDPVTILTASPNNFIESITNSNMAGIGNNNKIEGNYYEADPKQNELMVKLMEKLIEMLGKQNNTDKG